MRSVSCRWSNLRRGVLPALLAATQMVQAFPFEEEGGQLHPDHGWIHAVPTETGSSYFYDYALETWFWAGETSYPYLFKFGHRAAWYWFHESSVAGSRWFTAAGSGLSLPESLLTEPGNNELDFFVIIGQSNAVGVPEEDILNIPNEKLPDLPSGTAFDWEPALLNGLGDFRSVENNGPGQREAIGHRAGQYDNGCAWNAFALEWYRQTGRRTAFAQFAIGGTGIVSGLQYPGGNWTDRHATITIEELAYALQRAEALDLDLKFRGFLWHQGESDASYVTRGESSGEIYAEALIALFERFASAHGDRFLPINESHRLVSMLKLGSIAGNPDGQGFSHDNLAWEELRQAQESVAITSPLTRIVAWDAVYSATDGLNHDSVHYSQELYNTLGTQSAKELILPGSTRVTPNPPEGLILSTGPFYVQLEWQPSEDPFRSTRIYRKTSEDPQFHLLYQLSEDTDGRFLDMESPLNVASAQYRVVHANEWGESAPVEGGIQLTAQPFSAEAFINIAGPTQTESVRDFSNALADANLTAGLIRCYPLAEGLNAGQGATVFDLCRGLDLKLSDSTAWSSEGLDFDGTTTFLEAPSAAILPFTGPFTLTLLFKKGLQSTAPESLFASRSRYNGRWYRTELVLTAQESAFLFFSYRYDLLESEANLLPSGEWILLTLTYDDYARRLYLDEESEPILMTTNLPRAEEINGTLAPQAYIGASRTGVPEFSGTLGFVGVWNRVLSRAEILALSSLIRND
jgi:hypothetical protein